MTREKANEILEKSLERLEEQLDNCEGSALAAVSGAICQTYSIMHGIGAFDESPFVSDGEGKPVS